LGIKVTAVEPGGMKTRFAEPESLKVTSFGPAYDATVGATVAMMRTPEYTAALHDPAGHAAMILKLGQLDDVPSRILAGGDSFDYAAAADAERKEADLRWEAH